MSSLIIHGFGVYHLSCSKLTQVTVWEGLSKVDSFCRAVSSKSQSRSQRRLGNGPPRSDRWCCHGRFRLNDFDNEDIFPSSEETQAPLGAGFGRRIQEGAGFRVQGSGFRVQGSGFRVQGSGFRVQGSECRVQGAGCRVQGSRCVGYDAVT